MPGRPAIAAAPKPVVEAGADASHVTPVVRAAARTSRQISIADQCRQAVLDAYAPATILINHRLESLFTVGPIERYLQIAAGHPSHDLLAMAAPPLRTKLRSAIHKSIHSDALVAIVVSRAGESGARKCFRVDIRPVTWDNEHLLLVAFIDEPAAAALPKVPLSISEHETGTELEADSDLTRNELKDAIRELESSGEEQKAINQEARSVNEQYQLANEELVASKEKLQSLNQELTALNGQLQVTLERQRITSDDLQNVLFSTDVATIFLDSQFNIRFFTPATRLLFNVIASDIGRPLDDLKSLAPRSTPSVSCMARSAGTSFSHCSIAGQSMKFRSDR